MKTTGIKNRIKILYHYVLTVVIALGIALLLRLFIIDFYAIPSDSMEPTIIPGDFILVEKITFGARMYRNFDFLKTGEEPQTWRVKGFSPIQRGEVLVFNFPYRKGWNKISMHLSRFYVKRCIGLPGDTLSIQNSFYHINGQSGFGNLKEQQQLADFKGVFPPGIFRTIPFHPQFSWNITQLGPLYIPRKGDQIILDSTNYLLYKKMIEYEKGAPLQVSNRSIDSILNYTFQKNWYFLAGDHLWNSQDSRYIGLIPEDFIIGKAVCILTSQNPETAKFRWQRIFKKIQ